MRPTRGLKRNGPGQPYPPIWPCSTRGFPCLRCCHRSGGLLPHRFTLACAAPEQASERFCLLPAAECNPHRRFSFCGTFRSKILANPAPWRYQARCPNRSKTAESGLSSSATALRRTNQRSPTPPAKSIIEAARGHSNCSFVWPCGVGRAGRKPSKQAETRRKDKASNFHAGFARCYDWLDESRRGMLLAHQISLKIGGDSCAVRQSCSQFPS
jgi:hypothetical protein